MVSSSPNDLRLLLGAHHRPKTLSTCCRTGTARPQWLSDGCELGGRGPLWTSRAGRWGRWRPPVAENGRSRGCSAAKLVVGRPGRRWPDGQNGRSERGRRRLQQPKWSSGAREGGEIGPHEAENERSGRRSGSKKVGAGRKGVLVGRSGRRGSRWRQSVSRPKCRYTRPGGDVGARVATGDKSGAPTDVRAIRSVGKFCTKSAPRSTFQTKAIRGQLMTATSRRLCSTRQRRVLASRE
jgi:hypothetical protein